MLATRYCCSIVCNVTNVVLITEIIIHMGSAQFQEELDSNVCLETEYTPQPQSQWFTRIFLIVKWFQNICSHCIHYSSIAIEGYAVSHVQTPKTIGRSPTARKAEFYGFLPRSQESKYDTYILIPAVYSECDVLIGTIGESA